MEEYNRLIIGATFFGIGYAVAAGDCLVAEKTVRLGGEFSSRLKPGHSFHLPCTTLLGEQLKTEFTQRGVLTPNDQPILTAYTPILSNIVRKNNIAIHLNTRAVSILRHGSGYVAELQNATRKHIYVENIIDTTCTQTPSKSINAIIRKTDHQLEPALELYPAWREDLQYLKMKTTHPFPAARRELMEQICRNGLELVVMSEGFEYHYSKAQKTISGGYENPIKAFDSGSLMGGNSHG